MAPALSRLHVNFYGVVFAIESAHSNILERLKPSLAGFLESTAHTGGRCVLHAASQQGLAELYERRDAIIADGTRLLTYHRMRLYRMDDESVYASGDSFMLFNRKTLEWTGVISEATLQEPLFFENTLFSFPLWEFLSLKNLFMMHAAALIDSQGDGILMPGNSGHGKTSTTLALARAGFDVVTDDMVLVNPQGEVFPFSRDLHIDPRLAQRFPELKFVENRPRYYAFNSKRIVTLEEFTELYAPHGCTVRPKLSSVKSLIFPVIRPVTTSRLDSLSKGEALSQLIPPSVLMVIGENTLPAHLQTLKQFVENADCSQLILGRDAYADPSVIARLLAPSSLQKEPHHAATGL